MLLLAAAAFVGSQACMPCHGEIPGAYAKTPMALSSGLAVNVTAAEFWRRDIVTGFPAGR